MIRQLAFDLPLREARGRGDFFVSPANRLALASLDRWRGWPGGKMVLVGPAGSGKTHLAHVWARDSGARIVAARDLAALDLPALADLAAAGAAAVEDCADLGGDAAGERALFHLHNLLAESRGALLLTAAAPPRDWGLRLPDLVSRVQAAAVARLDPPDDALLAAVLLKLFADRQIAVTPALIDYLALRMDRSFAAAGELVAALDRRGLAERREVDRALAAEVLETLASRAPGAS